MAARSGGLLLVPVLLGLGVRASAAPEPMSRDEIIALAQSGVGYSYYWGHGSWRMDGANPGSCTGSCPDCPHTGQYGADCSGFASKVWQIPSPISVETDAHPYSTYNFRYETTHWDRVDRATLKAGDALVYNENGAGHIVIYERDDPWGSFWAYEARNCTDNIVHNVRTADSRYIGIRRHDVTEAPAPVLDAEAGGASGPLALAPGAGAPVWFEFANTGDVPWAPGSTRLGTQAPQDHASVLHVEGDWIDPARPTGADGACGPGATCRFSFTIRAPLAEEPTHLEEAFQLVQDEATWFGPVVLLQLDVSPPAVDATPAPPVPSGDAAPQPGIGPTDGLVGGCAIGAGGGPGRARAGALAGALVLALLGLASRRGPRRRGPGPHGASSDRA